MGKYEAGIEKCAGLFQEVKQLIGSVEAMWLGVSEVSKSGAAVKAKAADSTAIQSAYIDRLRSYCAK